MPSLRGSEVGVVARRPLQVLRQADDVRIFVEIETVFRMSRKRCAAEIALGVGIVFHLDAAGLARGCLEHVLGSFGKRAEPQRAPTRKTPLSAMFAGALANAIERGKQMHWLYVGRPLLDDDGLRSSLHTDDRYRFHVWPQAAVRRC